MLDSLIQDESLHH